MPAETSPLGFLRPFRHNRVQHETKFSNELGLCRKNTKYFMVTKSETHLSILDYCSIEPGLQTLRGYHSPFSIIMETLRVKYTLVN